MNFTIFRQFDDAIKHGFDPQTDIPLRRREVQLLTLIDREPDMPLHFYAHHVHLERGSFTYLSENLEIRGLLERIHDPEDRRRKTLHLTDQGKQVVNTLKKQQDDYLASILSTFTPEENTELEQALQLIERLLAKLPKNNRPLHPRHPKHNRRSPHHDE